MESYFDKEKEFKEIIKKIFNSYEKNISSDNSKKIHKIIMPLMNQNPTIDDLKKFFKNDVPGI